MLGLIFWGNSFVPMKFIRVQNEGLQFEGGAHMLNAKEFYGSLDYSIKENTD